MFSFFKRKKSSDDKITESAPPSDATESTVTPESDQPKAPDDAQTENEFSVGTDVAKDDDVAPDGGVAPDGDVATEVAAADEGPVEHENDVPVTEVPSNDTEQLESLEPKSSWLTRLKKGLSRTGQSI